MGIPWPCHRWLWREKSRFEVGVQGKQKQGYRVGRRRTGPAAGLIAPRSRTGAGPCPYWLRAGFCAHQASRCRDLGV